VRISALNTRRRQTYLEVLAGRSRTTTGESLEGAVMGKLKDKVAGGATGIGLAAAKRFIEEGAFVFIFGRRQTRSMPPSPISGPMRAR